MLSTSNSLKGKKAFDRVKTEGKLYQSDNFGVSVLERDDNEHSRFGFIVSTKVSKLATQRNRIKRALTEAVRYNLGKVGNGYDVVFLAKKNIAKKFTEEIMREVDTFLRKTSFGK